MADDIMDILKFTIPAITVFFIVYYLFRNFLQQQYQMEVLKNRQLMGKEIIPLKLQAYERLMMLCERMSVENLSYRLTHPDMGVSELKNAMLIAVQQEYEHNITQQVYVSESLWKIIKLAKEQIQGVIAETGGDTPASFMLQVKNKIDDAQADPLAYARSAIKNEAQLLMQ